MAQAECKNAAMNKYNSHFKSSYADLVEVRETVLPVFQKHGLLIQQMTELCPTLGFYLKTSVIHVETGEVMTATFPLNGDVSKIQAMGSSLSYGRRYLLSLVAGIAADSDNDGNEQITANVGGKPVAANVKSDGDGTIL